MKVITVESSEYMRAHLFPCRKVASGRRKKMKPTAEAQKQYNEKMAQHKLSDKIEANFTPNDWCIGLTYDDGHLPATVEEAMKRCAAYLRRLRRMIKSKGGDEKSLKYINITQQGRQGGRLHHHMILSAPGLEYSEIREAWGQGHARMDALEFNEDGMRGLSEYVLEGRATVKRWTCSHNLVEPVTKDYGPFALSVKEVKYINENPTDRDKIEKLFPGWKVSRVEPTPGGKDALGLFVTIYLYRENNAFFRYDRYGRCDYSYRPRKEG